MRSAGHPSPPARAGRIELFLGPMFAEKSTAVRAAVRRHAIAGRRCVIVKYAEDTRYTAAAELVTHDGQRQASQAGGTPGLPGQGAIRVVEALRLGAVELAPDETVVGVDEGQFYPDVVEACDAWAEEGRCVYVSALDGTSARKPFGPILDLVPLAEAVVKLAAVCTLCGDEGAAAAFTLRTSADEGVKVIGGADKYIAACRTCRRRWLARAAEPPPSPLTAEPLAAEPPGAGQLPSGSPSRPAPGRPPSPPGPMVGPRAPPARP